MLTDTITVVAEMIRKALSAVPYPPVIEVGLNIVFVYGPKPMKFRSVGKISLHRLLNP
jgi:hypothetical protein